MASDAPAPATARPRRRVLLIALAAIVLLVVAGAVVWAALDDKDDALVDAEQACEIIDRLPDEMTQDADSEDSRRSYLRLGAALSLALSAQEGDHEYDALAEAANKARTEHAADFKVSRDTLDDLRSECDEVG